ncbi:antibiotic biosynthesis monooxygenase [Synergistales bacterium]|nr:antibiotic biosynthesis monooxygenase [Synergistales bacterium]
MIVVTAKFKSAPGSREKIVELSHPAVEATRKEKGCIRYELFLSAEDDVTLQFVEEWTDADSLRAHLKSAHLAAFKEARKDLLAQDGSVLKIFEAKEISL